MTAPPGVAPATDSARPAIKRTNTVGLDPVQVRHLVDAGQWVAQRWELPIRRSRIRARAIRFLRDGRSDVDAFTDSLWYADPTGEKAVREVMRGAR